MDVENAAPQAASVTSVLAAVKASPQPDLESLVRTDGDELAKMLECTELHAYAPKLLPAAFGAPRPGRAPSPPRPDTTPSPARRRERTVGDVRAAARRRGDLPGGAAREGGAARGGGEEVRRVARLGGARAAIPSPGYFIVVSGPTRRRAARGGESAALFRGV